MREKKKQDKLKSRIYMSSDNVISFSTCVATAVSFKNNFKNAFKDSQPMYIRCTCNVFFQACFYNMISSLWWAEKVLRPLISGFNVITILRGRNWKKILSSLPRKKSKENICLEESIVFSVLWFELFSLVFCVNKHQFYLPSDVPLKKRINQRVHRGVQN